MVYNAVLQEDNNQRIICNRLLKDCAFNNVEQLTKIVYNPIMEKDMSDDCLQNSYQHSVLVADFNSKNISIEENWLIQIVLFV